MASPEAVILRARTAEPHLSWTFFANIVLDTTASPGSNYSCVTWVADSVVAPMHRNTYWAAGGARLVYGAAGVGWAEWQRGGHDADSGEADPRFVGAVQRCELFDVAADSPAAARGFANITRPAQWRPGCGQEMEESNTSGWHMQHSAQAYQWMMQPPEVDSAQ